LKLLYPTIMLVFISVIPFLSGVLDSNSLTSNFGLVFPGIGPIIMIVCSILLFLIGIWEKKYKNKLGIRTPNIRLNWSYIKKWSIGSKKI